jgi:acid phosphatase
MQYAHRCRSPLARMTGSLLAGASLAALAALCTPSPAAAQSAAGGFEKIKHFVVIYTENRSLDNLFGLFPGADGIESANNVPPQVDTDGTPLKVLPPVWGKDSKPENPVADARFPADLPNAPFPIETYVPAGVRTPDLVHQYYQQQEQINGGRNDRFAAVSDAGGLVMGYYKGDTQRLWKVAQEFTLADHFHHAAFGSSFLNHFWLVCACTPVFENAPEDMIAVVDEKTGRLARKPNSPKSALDGPPIWVRNGAVTPKIDGLNYGVNTIQPTYPPYREGTDDKHRLPPQTFPTIGERLSEKGVSWVWYSGGWAAATAGALKPYKEPEWFQAHHQPFNYFAAYAPGTEAREKHLKDYADFEQAIRAGDLPAVAFYKPVGKDNLHPGYADLSTGDAHVAGVIAMLRDSPAWKDMAIIVTADENGGAWDHVAPPKGDRWGPGSRVPTLIVSPYAKKGYVDQTVYDTTSILKTIETRFGVTPLGERDANAKDLSNAFDFSGS